MPSANTSASAGTPKASATTPAMRSRIVRAAACAALPLMSLPDDAAVGDVFGTFAVLVAVIFTRPGAMPNSAATTWATLV